MLLHLVVWHVPGHSLAYSSPSQPMHSDPPLEYFRRSAATAYVDARTVVTHPLLQLINCEFLLEMCCNSFVPSVIWFMAVTHDGLAIVVSLY